MIPAMLGQACKALDAAIASFVKQVIAKAAGIDGLTPAPATRGLPAVDSPSSVLFLSLIYVFIVSAGVFWIRYKGLKPRIKEPPFLRLMVVLHNLVCLSLSIYMTVGIVYQALKLRFKLWNNAYNDKHEELAWLIYVFYVSKYLEFMDTIIMLLKRNLRQITVLHVYHHCSVAMIWWVIAHHAPGGDAYFSAAVNSGVHVMMYLYYLMSALLREHPLLRHKYLFWGKYLTQVQMLQFAFNMVQAKYDLRQNTHYPRFLIQLLYYYMISLLLLFGNFYVHKYSSPSKCLPALPMEKNSE